MLLFAEVSTVVSAATQVGKEEQDGTVTLLARQGSLSETTDSVAFVFPFLDIPQGRIGETPGIVITSARLHVPQTLSVGELTADILVQLGTVASLSTEPQDLSSRPLSQPCTTWDWPAVGTFDFDPRTQRSSNFACALQQLISQTSWAMGDPALILFNITRDSQNNLFRQLPTEDMVLFVDFRDGKRESGSVFSHVSSRAQQLPR